MKKITINENQIYFAERIIKNDNDIKLINAVDVDGNSQGDLLFPNISNIDDFVLEEGKEWDVEVDVIEQLRIEQAQSNAEVIDLMMAMIMGGM